MYPESKVSVQRLQIIQDRASMLAKARAFFAERMILEVDCPILSHAASVDAHIDLISANLAGGGTGYLHFLPGIPYETAFERRDGRYLSTWSRLSRWRA